MNRIAIVEDDKIMQQTIQDYIERFAKESGRKLETVRYCDGDEIVEDYHREFDIILMDVQMQFMDGITAAKWIRERDPEVVIIFITNMAQYAIHGYEVNALDYVLKPINYFSFSEKLNRALERLEKKKKRYLSITMERALKKLEIGTIRYIESQGHSIIFHTEEGSYEARSTTMKELEVRLSKCGFYRCNKGYLVNLEHVEGIENGCAVIGGDKILISRLKRNTFWEALTNYVGDEVN